MKFTKNKAQFEIISAQEIVLKSNSVVQSIKDSARETIRTLRAATTQEDNGEIKTTQDITFRNISSAAAFVLGSNCNAKKYFSDVNFNNLNNVVNTTTTTTKQEETTTQKQEQTQAPAIDPAQEEEIIKPVIKKPSFVPSKEQADYFKTTYKDIFSRLANLFLQCGFNEIEGTHIINNRLCNNALHVKTKKELENVFLSYIKLLGAPASIQENFKAQFKNREFNTIYEDLQKLQAWTKEENFNLKYINERFLIYAGGAGTGKTYKATHENPKADVIIATADFSPSELLTKINPVKMCYELTALGKAMQEGKIIIIDEFNDYNRATINALKTILDSSVVRVHDSNSNLDIDIKEGFKIIATMNYTNAISAAVASRAKVIDFDISLEKRLELEASYQY